MDTSRWQHGDEFPVLGLVAQFQFKSPSSLSFRLGRSVDRNSPRLPEMGGGDATLWDLLLGSGGSVFVVVGWLDVHYPCDGLHHLQLRVGLPDRYISWEVLRDLVPGVIAAVGLPAGVSYHAGLAGMSQQISTEVPLSGLGS
ncbi:MAG TPA: hypothetical protein VH092_28805 [Urbifossiella sp.]|jgi:hypothetical protein|nr:hypothetical protein [Urbifossiella sp.]